MRVMIIAAALLALTPAAPASASQWGCKVALCLASPDDPMQYAECQPPIKKLYRELAKPDPDWPSCARAGGQGSSVSIRQNYYRHFGFPRFSYYGYRSYGQR